MSFKMAQASLRCRMMAPKMLQDAPRTLHLARGRAPARDRSVGARTYEGGLGTRARILIATLWGYGCILRELRFSSSPFAAVVGSRLGLGDHSSGGRCRAHPLRSQAGRCSGVGLPQPRSSPNSFHSVLRGTAQRCARCRPQEASRGLPRDPRNRPPARCRGILLPETSRKPPRAPRRAPGRSQEAPTRRPGSPNLLPRTQETPQSPPEGPQEISKIAFQRDAAASCSRRPPGGSPQEPPRELQGAPKKPQRSVQEPQVAPKNPPNGPQRAPKRFQKSPSSEMPRHLAPRGFQEGPESPPGIPPRYSQ